MGHNTKLYLNGIISILIIIISSFNIGSYFFGYSNNDKNIVWNDEKSLIVSGFYSKNDKNIVFEKDTDGDFLRFFDNNIVYVPTESNKLVKLKGYYSLNKNDIETIYNIRNGEYRTIKRFENEILMLIKIYMKENYKTNMKYNHELTSNLIKKHIKDKYDLDIKLYVDVYNDFEIYN